MEYKSFALKQDSISDEGIFTGLASTFGGEPDSYNDIVMPGAFTDTLMSGGRNKTGVALLYQHMPDKPVGVCRQLKEIETGLFIEGHLNLKKQMCQDLLSDMKFGAIRGLSIGYDCPEDEEHQMRKDGIRHLKKVNLWEVSVVTFPANTSAQTSLVKSIQHAKTVREIEHILREANIPNSAAKYMANRLIDRDDLKSIKSILNDLKQINS